MFVAIIVVGVGVAVAVAGRWWFVFTIITRYDVLRPRVRVRVRFLCANAEDIFYSRWCGYANPPLTFFYYFVRAVEPERPGAGIIMVKGYHVVVPGLHHEKPMKQERNERDFF